MMAPRYIIIIMRLPHQHLQLQLQDRLPPLAAPQEASRRGNPRSSLNRSRPASSRSAATRPSAVAVGSGSASAGAPPMPARGTTTMTTRRTTRPEPRTKGCVSVTNDVISTAILLQFRFQSMHKQCIYFSFKFSYIHSRDSIELISHHFTDDLSTRRMYHRIMEARRRREAEKAMFESHPDAAAAAVPPPPKTLNAWSFT